jgi:hypothetical protein
VPHGVRSLSDNELQQLRDRIEMLEEILGIGQSMVSRVRLAFGLSPSESRVLGMLLNRQLVTKDALYSMLYGHKPECDQAGWKNVDVFLCKVRKKLRSHGIELTTLTGDGSYVMKPQNKQRVRELLGLHEGEGDPVPRKAVGQSDFPTVSIKPPPVTG